MSSLIRSQSHGNNINVIYNHNLNVYSKITFTKSGQEYLNSEYNGIKWYENKNNYFSNNIYGFWRYNNYSRLDIRKIIGTINYYKYSIQRHEESLNNCILHYSKIWNPIKEFAPSHGDLTLDNVIFTSNGPVFFDWEHFSVDKMHWGFDIAYLILSAISLPYTKEKEIPFEDLNLFKQLWGKLREIGVGNKILCQPYVYFKHIFQTNEHWESIVKASPNKMFPLWMDHKIISQIHSAIND